MGENCDNNEGFYNQAHPSPMVLGCKRGGDITEGDTTEVKVYCIGVYLLRYPT